MIKYADTQDPGRGKRLTLTLHIINVVFVTIYQLFIEGGFSNLSCFFFSHHKRRSGWMVRFFLVISVILNFILLQMVVTPWAGQLPFIFILVDGISIVIGGVCEVVESSGESSLALILQILTITITATTPKIAQNFDRLYHGVGCIFVSRIIQGLVSSSKDCASTSSFIMI